MIFDEEGKPIALLFDEKKALSKIGDFDEKVKPIALLFDEKKGTFRNR